MRFWHLLYKICIYSERKWKPRICRVCHWYSADLSLITLHFYNLKLLQTTDVTCINLENRFILLPIHALPLEKLSCGWQSQKLSWQQDLVMMQLADRWQRSVTLPPPGIGRSEGLWAGCWGPTPWSPASPGPGCLIHLRQGGTGLNIFYCFCLISTFLFTQVETADPSK